MKPRSQTLKDEGDYKYQTEASLLGPGSSGLQNDYQAIKEDNTAVQVDESLYDALESRGLLKKPTFPQGWGIHLVEQGQIGLLLDNGHPVFLAPGRHTFWSPFQVYYGTKAINEDMSLGPIQIVTVTQGDIALSVKNGQNIILEPGRYILKAPHKFVKAEQANKRYIELGSHRRITVPAGHVAIAYDEGKQIIISPEQTERGPYISNSPTFSFDPRTGFQPTQLRVVELEELTVNTREMIPITVQGLITYRISNSNTAFFTVNDVHGAIKRQAEATLTNVYAHLSIDEIASSLSTERAFSLKGKGPEQDITDDFIHKATVLFHEAFKEVVSGWGVALTNLNIEKMEFVDKQFADTLRLRAQKRLETDTNLVNVDGANQVLLKQAECQKQQKIIEATGEAQSLKTMADARVYAAEKDAEAAEKLERIPLARELALLKGQAEVVKNMGNNTIFMPTDMKLRGYGNKNGNLFFTKPNINDYLQQPVEPLDNDQENLIRLTGK